MPLWDDEINGQRFTLSEEALERFALIYVPDRALRARMSRLFLFDMFVLNETSGVSPPEVMQAVRDVENGDREGITKPSSPFRHPPLKGLWHKHFFAAPFMPHNLLNAYRDPKRQAALTQEILDRVGENSDLDEVCSVIAERMVREELEYRANAQKMTGEWIIFEWRDGKPFYLCLSCHTKGGADDNALRERLVDFGLLAAHPE